MSYDRVSITRGLSKNQFDTYLGYAIESIIKVQAKIHRVVLSGEKHQQHYNYSYFKGIFETLSMNKDFKPDKRMPNYKTHLIVRHNAYILNIFITPVDTKYPPFRMEVTPVNYMPIDEYKNLLDCIDTLIPNTTISSVEYTLDIYCDKPTEVETLFIMMRRCLYIPYHKKARLYGESLEQFGNKTRMNAVFSLGDTKLYERGEDGLKKGEYWEYNDIGRVRLEHTAKWAKLRKHGIKSISSLIKDCHFFEVLNGIYKFRQFIGSKKLPLLHEWDSYLCKDSNGNCGAFQSEYLFYASINKNFRQYVKDIPDFEPLKVKLREAMNHFDSAWHAADIYNQYVYMTCP